MEQYAPAGLPAPQALSRAHHAGRIRGRREDAAVAVDVAQPYVDVARDAARRAAPGLGRSRPADRRQGEPGRVAAGLQPGRRLPQHELLVWDRLGCPHVPPDGGVRRGALLLAALTQGLLGRRRRARDEPRELVETAGTI